MHEPFSRRDVIDTSVLMDMDFTHRSQHAPALQLARKLGAEHTLAVIPAHWFAEYHSPILAEKRRLGAPLELGELKQGLPFPMILLPIDEAFIRDYLFAGFRNQIIDLKGGNMIFVAIAFKDRSPLITEDCRQHAVAPRLGIQAFTIAEYLQPAIDPQHQ